MPTIEAGQPTHTTLEVADVAASVRFYAEVLGLRAQQNTEHAGILGGSSRAYAACVRPPRLAPQPLLNYYARPVPDVAAVDAAHARIGAVRERYGIRQLTAPAREDPARFGVDTYGFYLQDRDTNWWEVQLWDDYEDPWVRTARGHRYYADRERQP